MRLGFTFTESQILALLLRRRICSTETLFTLLWGSSPDAPESTNAVAIHIHHLRAKLKKFGVEIKCRNRFGYSIHASHAAIIQKLINAADIWADMWAKPFERPELLKAHAAVLESAAVSDRGA